MSLEAINIIVKVLGQEKITGDLDSTVISLSDSAPIPLANGTGSRQADLQWSDSMTVGTGGTTLDLNALTDSLGRTINFAKVKVLIVKADDANTSTIIVGNGATSPFQAGFDTATWTKTLAAGAFIAIGAPVAGWASTTAVADKLKITGGAASQIALLTIIGTSA